MCEGAGGIKKLFNLTKLFGNEEQCFLKDLPKSFKKNKGKKSLKKIAASRRQKAKNKAKKNRRRFAAPNS